MRIALDTNVVVSAIGVDDPARQARAIKIVDSIPVNNLVLPVQVLAELFTVLTRKVRLSRVKSAQIVANWGARYAIEETTVSATMRSLQIATHYHVTIWDAIVLATAADSGCQMLLSEDMQHGFNWSGVTVVNPFYDPLHPLIEQALRDQ